MVSSIIKDGVFIKIRVFVTAIVVELKNGPLIYSRIIKATIRLSSFELANYDLKVGASIYGLPLRIRVKVVDMRARKKNLILYDGKLKMVKIVNLIS